LSNALWSAIFSLNLEVYNIFDIFRDPRWFQSVKFFFLGHAAFFLGSAAFRKYAIPKTLLAAFIIQNVLNLLGLIFILMLFGNLMSFGISSAATFESPDMKKWFESGGEELLVSLTFWLSAVILPLILYVAAYFKLKEREV
ncbi:MAG: hypothetical protein H8E61_10355, partial [Bacteroidetes bacterium]|nr:hypothetical protein [Bacteroidota bacterium]